MMFPFKGKSAVVPNIKYSLLAVTKGVKPLSICLNTSILVTNNIDYLFVNSDSLTQHQTGTVLLNWPRNSFTQLISEYLTFIVPYVT